MKRHQQAVRSSKQIRGGIQTLDILWIVDVTKHDTIDPKGVTKRDTLSADLFGSDSGGYRPGDQVKRPTACRHAPRNS
ncbi:hypothetical protein SAMN06265222_109104 [Neorhodopirellula lusitana]|uniref:Uncharacterized protein n=1 Tax=Neorhodopirellula lusitana TaxID=445327 RepID=A0ABY1QBH6_9BACT|nr:hypothetical protein SAMN06265222_109104 [Neorhodopirellula lusitana]